MTEGHALSVSPPRLLPGAATRVQSVERAAALLRAVAAASGPRGTATALGEAVGLNRASGSALADLAHDVLRDLAARARETAALAVVRDGGLALDGAAEVARRRAGAHHVPTSGPDDVPSNPDSPGGPTR